MKEFQKKHGSENCILLPPNISYANLADEISASPFIAEKRLVVVDGIPRGEAEDVEQLPEVIHPSCILVFVDPKPDKRLGTVKKLQKLATLKEFPHLEGQALRQWLQESAVRKGKRFQSDAIEQLLLTVGDDEDQLSTEVDKLVLGSKRETVEKADVERLCVVAGEQEVWMLTSLLVGGSPSSALAGMRSLLARGEDPHSLWNILLWFLRQVAAVAAAADAGQRTPAALGEKLQVPFPTAKILLPVVERVDRRELRRVLHEAIEDDIGLKTGKYRSTADEQQEVLAIVERLLLRLCSLFAVRTRSA